MLALASIGAADAGPLDDRTRELIGWVSLATGYAVGDLEVTVVIVEPKVINIVAYGTGFVDQSTAEAVTVGTAVLLPDWFQLGLNDDLLVHELTHVLQHANGATFACLEEQEREAYEVAAAFTDETGIGTKPREWFFVLLRCDNRPWAE